MLGLLAEFLAVSFREPLLWLLNRALVDIRPEDPTVRFFEWMGFRRGYFPDTLTVYRNGRLIRFLENQTGHTWHLILPRLNNERLGPTISTATNYRSFEFANLPTALAPDFPVPIGIRLRIGYSYRPSLPARPEDTPELLIKAGTDGRAQLLQEQLQVQLAQILAPLNPLALYLRREDATIAQAIPPAIARVFGGIGFTVSTVEVSEVHLPEALQTQVVSNLELLRQRTQHFTRDDFARLTITALNEGLRTGPAPLSAFNLNALLTSSSIPDHPVQDRPELQPPPSPPSPPVEPPPAAPRRTPPRRPVGG